MKRFDRTKEVPDMYRMCNLWLYLRIGVSIFVHALLWFPLWFWCTLVSLHPVIAFGNTKYYLALHFASIVTQYTHTIVLNRLYHINKRMYEKHRIMLDNYSETNQRDMKELEQFVFLFTESGDEIIESHSYNTYIGHLDKYDEYLQRVRREMKDYKSL